MLQVTDAAVDALIAIRSAGDFSSEAGVRISLVEQEGEQGIGLSFELPAQDDDEQVQGTGELEVFVASELVEPLGNAVLDVQETQAGAELTLREQGNGDHAAHGHEGHDHGTPG